MLEGAGATAYGIDVNVDALRQSRHQRITQACAHALPFPSGSFDVCVASHVIEHLESPNCFLHEAARVLRRGGKLILLYPWEIVRGMTIVPDIVMSGRFPSLSLMRRIHRHRVSPTRLCGFAEGTGMRHEHSRAFLGLPNFAVQYLTVLGKH
jgi:SAM-dependent methyltransferase